MLGLSFTSKLEWGTYIDTISMAAAKKIVAFRCSMNFLSPEVVLYLYTLREETVRGRNFRGIYFRDGGP